MGVSNLTGPRESNLTIPRVRKMAQITKIPRIVNKNPGKIRRNSQEKSVKLNRKYIILPITDFHFENSSIFFSLVGQVTDRNLSRDSIEIARHSMLTDKRQ